MILITAILTFINTGGSSDGLHVRYGFPFYFYMIHDFGDMKNGVWNPYTSWRILYLIIDIVIWLFMIFGIGLLVDLCLNKKKKIANKEDLGDSVPPPQI
jgi:hypothetical protein